MGWVENYAMKTKPTNFKDSIDFEVFRECSKWFEFFCIMKVSSQDISNILSTTSKSIFKLPGEGHKVKDLHTVILNQRHSIYWKNVRNENQHVNKFHLLYMIRSPGISIRGNIKTEFCEMYRKSFIRTAKFLTVFLESGAKWKDAKYIQL